MTRSPHVWAIAAASLALNAVADPLPALEFRDAPACRDRMLPPDDPPRLETRRDRERFIVTVLANFVCGASATDPGVDYRGETLTLSARTLLPEGDLLRCLCARKLVFSVTGPESESLTIRYVQDGRQTGELNWRLQEP